jgi:hypothetical protein
MVLFMWQIKLKIISMRTDNQSKIKRGKKSAVVNNRRKQQTEEQENYYALLRGTLHSDAESAAHQKDPIEEDFERLIHESDTGDFKEE